MNAGAHPVSWLSSFGLEGLPLPLALALLGLLPIAFMVLTAFVKISTVLHIARSALGADGVPSQVIILGLSAALTLVAMQPVATQIATRLGAATPSETAPGDRALGSLLLAIGEPLRDFMAANASPRETARFLELSRSVRGTDGATVTERDLAVVVPAFLVSELTLAFSLGVAIFLPFLVLDLLVGNVLTALGIQGLGVSQVSLPFKLLLFIAADGWGLLSQTLITGYRLG